MSALIAPAWAQAGTAAPSGQLAPLLMMVVFIAIFYFLLIRPQQKKAREHQALLAALFVGLFPSIRITPQGLGISQLLGWRRVAWRR